MLPSILTCPSCRAHLIPSESAVNEGYCESCDLFVSWKKRKLPDDPNDFLGGADLGDIEFTFENEDEPEKVFSTERATKFSKLGHNEFQLKSSTKKSIDKYEHSLYNPNQNSRLSQKEIPLIKPEYTDITHEAAVKPKKSKLPLILILVIPILILIGSYLIYANKEHISPQPHAAQPPETLEEINYEHAQQCLADYFASETWEDALKYTLPDPKIEASYEKYWKKHQLDTILHLKSFYLKDGKTISHFFGILTLEGSQLYYTVIEHDEMGVKVDWRYSNEIDEISILDFVSSPQSSANLIRGKLQITSFYKNQYPETQYVSYRLKDTTDNSLIVYVSKQDPQFSTLEEQFRAKLYEGLKSIPVILSVTQDPEQHNIAVTKKIISVSPQEDYFFYVSLPYYNELQNE